MDVESAGEESGGEDVHPIDVSENKHGESSDEESDENQMEVVSKRTYLPGDDDSDDEEGELECDESAYVVYHRAQTGSPCLSFDIIKDNLEDNRANQFPLTAYIAAGTQGERTHVNNVLVMKFSNMNKVKAKKEDENEEAEEDSESEDEDEKPELECALVHHPGCVNRIRVTFLAGNAVAASWSERGKVHLWDLSHPLRAVNNPHVMSAYVRNDESPKPLFSFGGHQMAKSICGI